MAIVDVNPFDICVNQQITAGAFTLNAAAESGQAIGRLHIRGGGTKTLSAAGGGKITVWTGAVTFATASTELRLGLEDLTAAGVGDGTQDVFGAKVAGTDTIAASSLVDFLMTSGTKTVSHGDALSISARLPVRAGADSVNLGTWTQSNTAGAASGLPYGAGNGSKSGETLFAVITFDDGTLGWISGQQFVSGAAAQVNHSINTGTNPDEIVFGFSVAGKIRISRIASIVDDAASGDNYELILYLDPYGSPSVVETVAITSGAITDEGTIPVMIWADIPSTVLTPGAVYGIALRATTANTIITSSLDLQSATFAGFKAAQGLFDDLSVGGRQNQTGAFSVIQTYYAGYFGITIDGLDDGASSGGGAFAYAFPG